MKMYGGQAKICATCTYWNGKRRPGFGHVIVENESGICNVVFTVTGIKRLCQEGCEHWDKWKVIK